MRVPQLSEEEIREIGEANKIPEMVYPVWVLAIRGYLLDSVGAKGKNDPGHFDDACFIVTPSVIRRYFHNTDPTAKFRTGVATMAPGIHLYGPGPHNVSKGPSRRYPAFRQAEPVTVTRDGAKHRGKRYTGWYGINIHKAHGWFGSYGKTSSLGCQTFPAESWRSFHDSLNSELTHHGNRVGKTDLGKWNPGQGAWGDVPIFPYLLIDETQRRVGNLVVSKRFFRK